MEHEPIKYPLDEEFEDGEVNFFVVLSIKKI